MSLEVELKLGLTTALTQPMRQQLLDCWSQWAVQVEQQPAVSLLNAYFDTAEQWFRRHDAGLRSRCKAGRYQQTIKLAGQQLGAAHVRPEYNQPCAGVVPQLAAFPADIWPEHTDITALQQQLTELFRTDFSRQIWLLTLADGSVVEAVLDEGLVLAGGRSQDIVEIELELVSGDAAQLFWLARQLFSKFPLCLGFQSKAERGYRLAQQQPLTVLPCDPDAGFSQLLRALQQNLALAAAAGAAAASLQPVLDGQWQQLQQKLKANGSAAALALGLAAPELQQGAALSLWLLDFSAWLLLATLPAPEQLPAEQSPTEQLPTEQLQAEQSTRSEQQHD